MPESPDQILDELDVEVPTAAYSFVVKEAQLDTDENHRVVKWSDPRDPTTLEGERRKDQTVEELTELVTREDHMEALVEAVQQARQRERRRILNKIQEKIDAVTDEINRLGNEENRPEPDVAKMHHEFQRNFLEELEEEVSEDV